MSKQLLAKRPKIIILRGNSGSGKSSTARILQAKFKPHALLIEQDHFRRKIIREKEGLNRSLNVELMLRIIEFGLEHNRDIILEGILSASHYSQFLKKIIRIHPHNNYFFYFDVSFDETLRRHQTKPNAHEFGETEMREWWREKDYLDFVNETIIVDDKTQNEIVAMICSEAGII